jgi:anthranilate phosphoribosyltransferase
MSLLPFLHRITAGSKGNPGLSPDLSQVEAHQAMGVLLEGASSDAVIAAFLIALKMKGEAAAELIGFARAMRERMIVVDAGADVIDTCGTGGDASGTFNISTAAALVMAGAGAHVAKHGNRSFSSASGSADVLEALGIRIAMTPEESAQAVREIGIGFLFAPHLHPAMKFVGNVRSQLKLRTVFNLLGPLVNPAQARRQLIGAPSAATARLMAEALSGLGTQHAFVVHGHDGLDEVSTTGPTDVWEVTPAGIEKHLWTPADFGVKRAALQDLSGADPAFNARLIEQILGGAAGAPRDVVIVNAAAGLLAADLALDLRSAFAMAAHSIDSGAAAQTLERLKKNFPFS